MKNYIKQLLIDNERSPSWLSRKIGISHTMVHNWIKGIRPVNPDHFEQVCKVFNVPLKKALKDIN